MGDEKTSPADEQETLKKELETCTQQREEYLNGWKRAKADYINYKNETEKRRDEMAGFALMTTAGQFIPLLDNFKKAFELLPGDLKGSEWVRGIEQIWKQMKEMMKGFGIEEFTESVIGAPFDPMKHHAVGEERIDTVADNAITQEVSPGYTFRGSPLVPAKVIVNRIPESKESESRDSDGESA